MRGLQLFVLNFINFFVLIYNFRAVAQARYVESVISDAIIAVLTFTIMRRVSNAHTLEERIGYVGGAAAASAAGIYVTRWLFAS